MHWQQRVVACCPWLIPAGKLVSAHHENHHLLGGGESEKEDSASEKEDKILLFTCISFLHTGIIHRQYPTANHYKSPSFSLAAELMALLFTCTYVCIIPRLNPTPNSSSFSVANSVGVCASEKEGNQYHRPHYWGIVDPHVCAKN